MVRTLATAFLIARDSVISLVHLLATFTGSAFTKLYNSLPSSLALRASLVAASQLRTWERLVSCETPSRTASLLTILSVLSRPYRETNAAPAQRRPQLLCHHHKPGW